MKKSTIIALFIVAILLIGSQARSWGASAVVSLRPTHIDISSATSESAVLITLSAYTSDDARYRLYNGSNQYNCWNEATDAYVTSTSYSSGPLVPGTPSTTTTFWILSQAGNNLTTTASYRDRLGPGYSSNYQTVALPAATSITSGFNLSGTFTGVTIGSTTYDNSVKHVVLGYSGATLISAASTTLSSGAFTVVCPTGTTIDKIEIRSIDNTLLASLTGSWTTTTAIGSIPANIPSIVASSLTGFGNIPINTTSAEQNYLVSGSYLTDDITITPPDGFEISTGTGAGFVATNPIVLTQTGGNVASTPIYVRFVPTLAQVYSGNITHVSSGATTVNVAVSGTGVTGAPEPTNHVTGFTAGTATTSTIPLTWTDATGGTLPENYLIKASSVSYAAIADPVDGVPETDGALVQNVAQGVQAFTFINLNQGTPYYFKIYPYTNSGTSIDYKTTAPVPTATATTIASSALLLYEDFNYAPPAYIGGNTAIPSSSNNWDTHNGGGGTIDIFEPGLSYPGLAASSGYKVRLPGDNGLVTRDVNRALIGTPNTSAIMYYSALINVVDATQLANLTTSDYFMHFITGSGSNAGTTYGARLGLHAANEYSNYRFSVLNHSGGTTVFTDFPQDLNFGETYLVVVKFDRTTTPTTASLWVNPSSLGGAEPAGAVVNTSGTNTFSQFGSIALRNSSTSPKADIDEIRVGTTWADVTPAGQPTLATDPTSLSGFLYFVGSGPSTSQSFTIDGSALSPETGSLTVSESASYEVSADDITFGATATVTYNVATFTSAPVYIRLKAGLAVGSYDGESVTVSGGGATSVAVICNGTVAPPAPIIIAGTLEDFGNQVINAISPEKTYNVSGNYLTGDIIIAPPTGFEISTASGGSFVATNPIVLTPVSGVVASTPIYVRFVPTLLQAYSGNIAHTSSGATTVNVAVSGIGIKGEPTEFPADFATGIVTGTTIDLSWTDAVTGTFIPDGYLIKGSSVGYGSIVNPTDQVPEANSALVQNVAQGIQAYTFTGLTPGATYYFQIYPYTNSGSAINYKVFPQAPQATVQTTPPPATTYTWNQTESALWTVSTNWTPERTAPALNDILVFDGAVTDTATATGIPAQTVAQLLFTNGVVANLQGTAAVLNIAGASGTDFDVPAGCTLNVNGTAPLTINLQIGASGSVAGNMTLSASANKLTAVDASGVTFQSGSVFTTGTGFTSNPFGTANLNSIVFASGSTFIFTTGSNPFGAGQPNSVVVFQTGSLYWHKSTNAPGFSGRTYADFKLESATANLSATGTAAFSIDNLTIVAGTLNLNLTATTTISQIKGNISVSSGATLNFNPASATTIKLNGPTQQTITNNGNFGTGANATLEIDNAAGIVLNSAISTNGSWKFTNGLLNLGSNNLTLGATSTITGTPSVNSMVVATGSGELRKTFAATGPFTFPVGDNDGTAEFSPVTVNVTAGTFASAYVGVNLVNAAYPGSTGNYLNRYWNLTSGGITGVAYDVVLNYPVADVTGNESEIYCFLVDPATYFNLANTTLHELTATGVTSFGTFTGKEQSANKTLNLKLYLEGLYAGAGLMNQAFDESGPKFAAGIADQVTVVLYDGIGLVYTASNVDLSTSGDISIQVPATYSGNYYIGVKHRNSIETASADPIQFAGQVISYDFSTAATQAFGANQKDLNLSGVFGFFGGDENQDGLLDSSDMIDADNDAAAFAVGYLATDINGDGLIDSSDMIYIDNNVAAFVAAVLPY